MFRLFSSSLSLLIKKSSTVEIFGKKGRSRQVEYLEIKQTKCGERIDGIYYILEKLVVALLLTLILIFYCEIVLI